MKTVSIWPENEAYRKLLEAIQNCKEIHGSHDTTDILQKEITREVVVREYHASRREVVAAEAALQQANELLTIAVDALGFYAEEGNYPVHGQSVVAKDKGRTAAQALEAINSEGPQQPGEIDHSNFDEAE